MGLLIQSLENIPPDAKRDYYIYLLDYGWTEPLGEALMNNYERMADFASENNAVIIRGTQWSHFEDEVFSWHDINGENAQEILPAVLITNRNPHHFRHHFLLDDEQDRETDLKLILIPLKKFCTTTSEVVSLIIKLFSDIKAKKDLSDFSIAREVEKGDGNAVVDSLILQPASGDEGIQYSKIIEYLSSHQNAVPNSSFVQKTVYPIHFEDRSGIEFERLVFAFIYRMKAWNKLEWLGQTGGDSGRDIWGEYNGESYCYQCANYKTLPFSKVSDDIDKLRMENFIPDHFILVCGGKVSAAMRSRISSYASSAGINSTEIWSGVELEEKVRLHTPELIQRFVNGETLPETPAELLKLLKSNTVKDDNGILELLVECFDRPAFTTAFRGESNIPNFEKAITDTIELLNTGVHRLRDGTVIRNIPSRHSIKDTHLKKVLAEITQMVIRLRDRFVQLKREKEIRPCGCNEPDCPTWFLSDKACDEMDGIRKQIFKKFKGIYPEFNIRLN